MKLNYKPKLLFLEITTECNLRCKQCFMWKLKDAEKRLTKEEYLNLIDDFHQLNEDGAVILTGGEIFLQQEILFAILNKCNTLNIQTVINTNGTLIPSELYSKIVINGPSKLVFSLDSHKRELHDFIRGVTGTFDSVVSTISNLLSIRNKMKLTQKKVFVSTIIHNENIDELDSIISFAKDLEVDGIAFQPLIPTFSSKARLENDFFFKNYFFKDIINAMHKIDKLIERLEINGFVLNTRFDLANVKEYIANPHHTPNFICKAHENNLVVDHVGNLKYCYNMDTIFVDKIGNIRNQKISDMIYSKNSEKARKKMKTCNLSCGVLNCNK